MSKLLQHVLNLVNSSAQEMGIERDRWRFRIAPDPRLFMDELQGRAFYSFYGENLQELRQLLHTLRDDHHFVLPHNNKIDAMTGNFVIMFLVPGPEGRRPLPTSLI